MPALAQRSQGSRSNDSAFESADGRAYAGDSIREARDVNTIQAVLLLPATLCLVACEADHALGPEAAALSDERPEEFWYPREVRVLLRSREARDTPLPAARFSEASRGEGEDALQVLAEAMTSRDDNQAHHAAAAIMRLYGCDAVRGEVRKQAVRQMRTYPTPYGALLLGCLDHDTAAVEALKSLEPVVDLRWFGSPFRDWETVQIFSLAEAGHPVAKRVMIERMHDLDVRNALLQHSLFPYIRDRDMLMALTGSLLDDRLTRPGEPTDTDYPNPQISDMAFSEFDSRFALGVRGDRVPTGGYTAEHKLLAYGRARQLLEGLEEGAKVPQGRRAGEALRRAGITLR